jgi:ATP-binding cassette subfamily F protein uup
MEFSLSGGQKCCLIGRNGCGKSTLLKVLASQVELDKGTFFRHPAAKVAYLPQEALLPSKGTIENVLMEGLAEEEAWRVDTVTSQLGIDKHRSLEGLSGGEKRRVNLAQVMLQEADVLLLDEPTNHLDLPAVMGLEAWIQSFRGAVLVISHDRQFLRRISTSMAFIDRGVMRLHAKGYAFYEEWSQALMAEEEAHLSRLNKTLEAETQWLHRGVTGRRKRNQGRLRRLMDLRQDRAKHIAPPGKITLAAPTQDVGSRLVMEAQDIGKAYLSEGRERWVLRHFSTRILRGDRIGIVGANGSGKTTLVRLLTGELTPDEGTVRQGVNVDRVYFDQHRKLLDPKKTLWETLCPQGGDHVTVQGQPRHVVAYLRDFLFAEKQAKALVGTLSGGEANRLMLAALLATPSHVMVLDEPTNDLDIDTLDLLEEMLSDYTGTLLIVSHDRDFLDRLVTSTILVSPQGQVQEYAGGFTEALAQAGDQAWLPKSASPSPSSSGKKKEKTDSPKKPGLTYQQQRSLAQLPSVIDTLTKQIKSLEDALADSRLYSQNPVLFTEKTHQLEKRKEELAKAEEEWMHLASLEESLG